METCSCESGYCVANNSEYTIWYILIPYKDKSASTFQFTLSALDAKRNDEGCYSTAYFKKAAQNG